MTTRLAVNVMNNAHPRFCSDCGNHMASDAPYHEMDGRIYCQVCWGYLITEHQHLTKRDVIAITLQCDAYVEAAKRYAQLFLYNRRYGDESQWNRDNIALKDYIDRLVKELQLLLDYITARVVSEARDKAVNSNSMGVGDGC